MYAPYLQDRETHGVEQEPAWFLCCLSAALERALFPYSQLCQRALWLDFSSAIPGSPCLSLPCVRSCFWLWISVSLKIVHRHLRLEISNDQFKGYSKQPLPHLVFSFYHPFWFPVRRLYHHFKFFPLSLTFLIISHQVSIFTCEMLAKPLRCFNSAFAIANKNFRFLKMRVLGKSVN